MIYLYLYNLFAFFIYIKHIHIYFSFIGGATAIVCRICAWRRPSKPSQTCFSVMISMSCFGSETP